jgi:hypothetical protein
LAVLLTLILPAPPALAQDSTAAVAHAPDLTLSDPFAEIEVLRCLFKEKRLVVRSLGQLFVVHDGEDLPGGRVRFRMTGPTQALLVEGGVQRARADDSVQASSAQETPSGRASLAVVPRRMLLYTLEADGTVSVQTFASDDPEVERNRFTTRAEVSVVPPSSAQSAASEVPTGGTPAPKGRRRKGRS